MFLPRLPQLLFRTASSLSRRGARNLHLSSHHTTRLLAQHNLPVHPLALAKSPEHAHDTAAGAGGRVWVGAEGPAQRLGREVESADEARRTAKELLDPANYTFPTPAPTNLFLSPPLPALSHSLHLLLHASRSLHTPALTATTSNGEASTLPLDIRSTSIQDTLLVDFLERVDIPQASRERVAEVVKGLWSVWRESDALRLEITLGVQEGSAKAVLFNPTIQIDPFALHRQPALAALPASPVPTALEKVAKDAGVFYLPRGGDQQGDIGCYGYGAGLAMSTMDALTLAGGKPANFLDGGGGATPANVASCLSILFSTPRLRAIFINSFGGLTKTDLIAEGIVSAVRARLERGEHVPPMVVRLRGTGEERAAQVLKEAREKGWLGSDGRVEVEGDMGKAARWAVELARQVREREGRA